MGLLLYHNIEIKRSLRVAYFFHVTQISIWTFKFLCELDAGVIHLNYSISDQSTFRQNLIFHTLNSNLI